MFEPRTDDRTHYEASLDASYAACYMHLQERFYKKVKGLMVFMNLFASSAAGAAFYTKDPTLAAYVALAITVMTIADVIVSPSDRIAQSNELYRRYTELHRQSKKLTMEEIDERLGDLRAYTAPSIESLRVPAYNQVVHEISRHDYALPMTLMQRVMRVIA